MEPSLVSLWKSSTIWSPFYSYLPLGGQTWQLRRAGGGRCCEPASDVARQGTWFERFGNRYKFGDMGIWFEIVVRDIFHLVDMIFGCETHFLQFPKGCPQCCTTCLPPLWTFRKRNKRENLHQRWFNELHSDLMGFIQWWFNGIWWDLLYHGVIYGEYHGD